VLVVVFAATFLGDRPGWRTWVGVSIVVLGVALVASDARPDAASAVPTSGPSR
jgi:drug/metabolite transporter (DMT)-like permease